MSIFDTVISLPCVASSTPVFEMDYHTIVKILRHYDNHRQSPQDEQEILTRVGWPQTYYPCDHMENITFVLVFTRESCLVVATLSQEYCDVCVRVCMQHCPQCSSMPSRCIIYFWAIWHLNLINCNSIT